MILLFQALNYAVRSKGSKEPLVKRLQAILSKITSVKFKDNKITEEVGQSILETLTGKYSVLIG